ncbi:MAG: POTRA domain-containing protein, partial [Bacteroidia bacterium]|nr:POTRA domain-containing protein [Bacteroidia bacterium]
MKNLFIKNLLILLPAVMLAVSCSTTRTLSEGEYRLAKNSITVTNSDSFNTNSLSQYIKQEPNRYFLFGWNPFLNIYNMADKDNDSGWGRFCRKIGNAPVVYSPEAVETSIDNLKNHLEYLGYYDSSVNGNVSVDRRKVSVEYEIALGKQYRIDSLTYTLPQRGSFKDDFMADLGNVMVHEGDYLSEEVLENETVRGSAHFRDIGYFGFTKNYYLFEADTTSVPGKLFLNMIVNEYTRNEPETNAKQFEKSFIDSVSISYPKSLVLKDKILRNLNTIKPGDM